MILTRRQFAKLHNSYKKGLGSPKSALWIPDDPIKSMYFVCIRPIVQTIADDKPRYWDWCKKNCRGQVRCYSTTGGDSQDTRHEEWWGFSEKDDILLWRLRWE